MVTSLNDEKQYRVVVSNGEHEIIADTTIQKGGAGSAMRPHELLEAALAACLNMTIRMYADKKGIPLTKITTRVTADRDRPGETIFRYSYAFDGCLTDRQLEGLHRVAAACPVQMTLANRITFISDYCSDPENISG